MNGVAAPDHVAADWTRGGDGLVYQHCLACGHHFYFRRNFCPVCGAGSPQSRTSAGKGVVHASTLVQRAASEEFRAIVPYRIVLVDLAEGFRVMAHGDSSLQIGDGVRCAVRTVAARLLPFFDKESHVS